MGYISFGVGGLVFAIVIVPWIWLSHRSRDARGKSLRRAISRAFRFHVEMLRTLGVFEYQVIHPERLYPGQLVIANHPTLMDVVFLVSFTENAACVVKDSLFQNFFIGFVIRTANYISNKDPELMIKAGVEAIDRGESLIIFPEGTRTVPGQISQLQRGAAYIGLEANRPLRPVHISCVPSTMTKAESWYEIPDRAMQYEFLVDEEIKLDRHYNKPRALAARGVNEDIQRVLFSSSE